MKKVIDRNPSLSEDAVLEAIAKGPMDVDELLARFPPAQRNQVLIVVDTLSRRRLMSLWKPGGRSYVIGPGGYAGSAGLGQAPQESICGADACTASFGKRPMKSGLPPRKSIE